MEIINERDEAALRQHQQFERNSDWLAAHIAEVFEPNRGRFVCVAGQQAFVADTVEEAIARATAAHPEDQGFFTRYIPKEKLLRIYAF